MAGELVSGLPIDRFEFADVLGEHRGIALVESACQLPGHVWRGRFRFQNLKVLTDQEMFAYGIGQLAHPLWHIQLHNLQAEAIPILLRQSAALERCKYWPATSLGCLLFDGAGSGVNAFLRNQKEKSIEIERLHPGAEIVTGPHRIDQQSNVVALEGKAKTTAKTGFVGRTRSGKITNAKSALVAEQTRDGKATSHYGNLRTTRLKGERLIDYHGDMFEGKACLVLSVFSSDVLVNRRTGATGGGILPRITERHELVTYA